MKAILCAAVLVGVVAQSANADSTVERAQQTLKEQGFYYGQVNGEKNADTIAAIRRFQIRSGLQVTGELNAETLAALNSRASSGSTTAPQPAAPSTRAPGVSNGEEPAQAPAPAPGAPTQPPVLAERVPEPGSDVFAATPFQSAPPELQRRVIVSAQTLLWRRGFYKAEIDGIPGPAFGFSLRAYQSTAGLPVTGRLDLDTLGSLGLLPGQQQAPGLRPAPRVFPRQPLLRPPVRGEWIREGDERRRDEEDEDRD